jgi:hypothetical protein
VTRPAPDTFRPDTDTPANRRRLDEQRARVRQALADRNGACPVCRRPRNTWPMVFRGDRACSIRCEKTLPVEGAA